LPETVKPGTPGILEEKRSISSVGLKSTDYTAGDVILSASPAPLKNLLGCAEAFRWAKFSHFYLCPCAALLLVAETLPQSRIRFTNYSFFKQPSVVKHLSGS